MNHILAGDLMICARCGKEVGDLFCGNCKAEVQKEGLQPEDKKVLIPILFWNAETESYVAGCTCLECAWNRGGFCSTEHINIETIVALIHPFDGDNIIHQACG